MQLDSTRIAIRERSMLEILDLALHVIRQYGGPLSVILVTNALPFALLNGLLLWRVADPNYNDGNPAEYLYVMALLIFFEAQWATSLLTVYLGKAVFLAEPTWGEIWADFRDMFWQLLWVHGVMRLTLPALVLVFFLEKGTDFYPFAHGLLILGAIVAACIRAWRPYITEIVLLERNPLWSWEQDAITVGIRSSKLHDPNSGELIARWLGVAVLCGVIGTALVMSARTTLGVFFNHWGWGPVTLHFVYPLVLWTVAGYVAVVRFLSYLNLRIHREGWEVELKMRAEASRLTKSWI